MEGNLKCPIHKKEQVVTCCLSMNCARQGLICPLCPDLHQDHYSQIVGLSEYFQRVSRSVIESNKWQRVRDVKMEGVLKWCEDDEMHLKKLEEHLKAQKLLISEDLNFLRELLHDKCVQIELQMNSELDDWMNHYKEQFRLCKLTVDETFNLHKYCYPFSNQNALLIKLQQSTPNESLKLTQQLKKLLNRKDSEAIEALRQSTERIQEMTVNLPVYSFQEGIESLCQNMAELLQTHLKQKLNIPKRNANNIHHHDHSLSLPPANHSPHKLQKQHSLPPQNENTSPQLKQLTSFQVSANNKSIQGPFTDINLKPLKKYQLDFSVSCVEVVTPNLFAMTCSNDPHLRIFDTTQKRIHTLSSHMSPITQMQKALEQPILGINNSSKQSMFLFTLSSDCVIVWNFDHTSQLPHVYVRYSSVVPLTQICYLQDNTCLVLGEADGGIEVYNFQQQKCQQPAIRDKHSKSISAMVVIKKNERFVVGCQDGLISIWRMNYNGTFQSCYCESQMSVGIIQSLYLMNSGLVVAATVDQGLKIVNIQNQIIVMEIDKNSSVCDCLIAENPKYQNLTILTLMQSSKQLKLFKIQYSHTWTHEDSKCDVALSPTENMVRSKMQLVQIPNQQNPLVLLANEPNKELLVYEIMNKQ